MRDHLKMPAPADFFHLHLHSEYSLLDGAIRPEDLAAHLRECGMKGAAVTDHGALFGAIEFYDALTAEGLKPVLGMEAYLAPGSMALRESNGRKAPYFHLTLLALDREGYRNLCRLSSLGWLEGYYYKPRIDREALARHCGGLAIGSACLQGDIAQHLLAGDHAAAASAAGFYIDLVGRERFFIEMMDHGLPEERGILRDLAGLARSTGARLAATNDAHYLRREHARAHEVLLCVQTNRKMDDPGRMRFGTDEFYVKTPLEMERLFDWAPESIRATAEIAEMCEFTLEKGETLLPAFPIPEGSTMGSCLGQAAVDGLRERLGRPLEPAETARLEYELRVIEEMGFPGYFLIVSELRRWAAGQGIAKGPGRGSSAGSLVSFATGITDVNPLEHGLSFDRFLNPSRKEMPDIDLDFCYSRRSEIIDHIVSLYGRNSVCQILTVNRMKARSVIRDVMRAMGQPLEKAEGLVRIISQAPEQNAGLDRIRADMPALDEMAAGDPAIAEALSHCSVLENLARNTSVHAAGVIIAPGDLLDYVPLCRAKDEMTTQYEMKSLDRAGLLKLDVLGLRTTTVLQQAERMAVERGAVLSLADLPLDDPDSLSLLRSGETTGVFQLESSGMRDALRRIGVDRFADITAAVAIFRPGSMHMIDTYAQNKLGVEGGGPFRISYLHPELEQILSETYGVMIYQEQVMAIANRLGGMTMAEADVFRKAMSKKNPEVMARQRERFTTGAVSRGIPKAVATGIFDLMEKFAGYGFNKSHAVCYALLAYQTAYMKAHHPAEFIAASMSSQIGNIEQLSILAEEARRMGIEVLAPSVNESRADFGVDERGRIVYALAAIRNVGEGPSRAIVEERLSGGPYRDVFDFASRTDQSAVNRRVFESLAGAGAFDCVSASRAALLSGIDLALDYGSRVRTAREAGQMSLFGGTAAPEASEPALPDAEELEDSAILTLERSLLGFYLSGHPLDRFCEEIEAFTDTLPGEELPPPPARRRMAGAVAAVKEIPTRSGVMAFVTLEGRSGSSEVILFSEQLEKYRPLLEEGMFLLVEGEVNERREERRLSVASMCPLDRVRDLLRAGVLIRLDSWCVDLPRLSRAVEILRGRPGRASLRLEIRHPSGWLVLAESRSIRVEPDGRLLRELRDVLGAGSVSLTAGIGSL